MNNSNKLIIFLIALLTSACSGGGGGGNGVAAVNDRFALVLNRTSDSVMSFAINSTTGRMTLAASTDISSIAGYLPRGIAVHPGGQYVYVTDSSVILPYKLNSNGSLSRISTGSYQTANGGWAIVAHPSGQFLYVSSDTDGTIRQFNIDANGSLAAMTPGTVTAGTNTRAMVMDNDGKHIYAANWGGTFGINHFIVQADGTLIEADCDATAAGVQSCDTGSSPFSVIMTPDNRFIYVANDGSSNISQFRIETDGSLTPLGTVASAANPNGLAVDPNGQFLYVSSWSNVVTPYSIGTDGILTRIDCDSATPTVDSCPAGGNPVAVSVDVTGKYVRVANQTGNTISQYRIATDGSLVALAPAETASGAAPVAIAMTKGTSASPVSRYAYLLAESDPGTVYQYSVEANGDLVTMPTPSVNTATNSFGFGDSVVHPFGKYLYTTNSTGRSVSQFEIGIDGGLLRLDCDPATVGVQDCILGAGASWPLAVAVHPSGRFAYVGNSSTNDISQFNVAADGTLSAMTVPTVALGRQPMSITIDASGRYLYITHSQGINRYLIAAGGSLSSPVTAEPLHSHNCVKLHPSGKYAYSAAGDALYQYDVAADGSLVPMATPSLSSGNLPKSLAVHPSGQYVYMVRSASDLITQFTVGSDGSLTQMATSATIPSSGFNSDKTIVIDAAGKNAYLTHKVLKSIIKYSIGSDGSLTQETTDVIPDLTINASLVSEWQ